MNIFKAYFRYLYRKKQIDKIEIYPNGGFELSSEHLFQDKEKTLEYLKVLNKLFRS